MLHRGRQTERAGKRRGSIHHHRTLWRYATGPREESYHRLPGCVKSAGRFRPITRSVAEADRDGSRLPVSSALADARPSPAFPITGSGRGQAVTYRSSGIGLLVVPSVLSMESRGRRRNAQANMHGEKSGAPRAAWVAAAPLEKYP